VLTAFPTSAIIFEKGVCVRSTLIFVAAVAAAVIWFFGFATIPPMGLVLGAAGLLAGLALGLNGARRAVAVGLVLSAVPFVLTALNIAIGVARDPTSHNLFPFELLIALAIGLVPAAGLSIGYAIPRGRIPPRSSLLVGSLAALVALSSPALSLLSNGSFERSVAATLRRLLAAENEYRAASPSHRFTCEGPLLPGFEHERWLAWTQLGLATPDHFQGPGGYWFTLRCGPLSRGDDLSIEASKGYGGDVFTIDASGTIRRGPLQSR
jgi:hypothetical protein